MGSSGPHERRDLPTARGQTATGDLAPTETPAAEAFDSLFAAIPCSPTLRRIWHDAYGLDYPEEADPVNTAVVRGRARLAPEAP